MDQQPQSQTNGAPTGSEGQALQAATPPPSAKPGVRIPDRIRHLARLTPEHLPRDGDHLLAHIDAAIEHFQPQTTFDFLEVVRIGRHQYEIATLQAYKHMLQRRTRRVALRTAIRPGWRQPEPGTIEARRVSASTPAAEAGVVAMEAANTLVIGEEELSLDLACYANDAAIEAAATAVLTQLNLGPFAIDAEAFKLGLPEQAALTQLITSEESRCAKLIDDYLRRHAKRPPPPIIDAEFEAA